MMNSIVKVGILFLFDCLEQALEKSNLTTKSTQNAQSDSDLDSCVSEVYPCSNYIMGNLVLIVYYGLTLAFSAKMISDGAEMLLDLGLAPALIGGVILPVSGVVPDSMMILVSGLGTKAAAQDQISVGMGTLAGMGISFIPWKKSGPTVALSLLPVSKFGGEFPPSLILLIIPGVNKLNSPDLNQNKCATDYEICSSVTHDNSDAFVRLHNSSTDPGLVHQSICWESGLSGSPHLFWSSSQQREQMHRSQPQVPR